MKAAVALLMLIAAPAGARTQAPVIYTPSLRCTAATATASGQARADALIAAFEREYPAALVDPARVEQAMIAPATLQVIVANLACLSKQPGADPFVPEQAAALFASRRYGKAAFALLARTREARFARQMRDYTTAGR